MLKVPALFGSASTMNDTAVVWFGAEEVTSMTIVVYSPQMRPDDAAVALRLGSTRAQFCAGDTDITPATKF